MFCSIQILCSLSVYINCKLEILIFQIQEWSRGSSKIPYIFFLVLFSSNSNLKLLRNNSNSTRMWFWHNTYKKTFVHGFLIQLKKYIDLCWKASNNVHFSCMQGFLVQLKSLLQKNNNNNNNNRIMVLHYKKKSRGKCAVECMVFSYFNK